MITYGSNSICITIKSYCFRNCHLVDIFINIVISSFAIDVIIIIGSIINVSHCDLVTINVVVDTFYYKIVG